MINGADGRVAYALAPQVSSSRYILFQKSEAPEWEEVQLSEERNSYVFYGLQCGMRYQFYLVAFNVAGRGQPSDVISARTEGTAGRAAAVQSISSPFNTSPSQPARVDSSVQQCVTGAEDSHSDRPDPCQSLHAAHDCPQRCGHHRGGVPVLHAHPLGRYTALPFTFPSYKFKC
ncbi:down syndrome cell adhesion molecule-like protein Dscam2 [Caerostris extrusa]|uniref:Down syndrome cell adhesion molecule-like protein Dscam2 n=1 Tax=Caerostris extrusa TaxID=172846 RepID=A0AAV4Y807_CAEEX|nr:down syndrome cell adhesion molecule-like protein Dscam2 [Caerostris extrusa]